MDFPNEDILASWSIDRDRQNSKLFYCSVCPVDNHFQDWKKHIKARRHELFVQRLTFIIEPNGSKLECKICQNDIEKNLLKDHAKYHRIVPWYQPSDLYPILFRNHVMEWKNQFYCCLCKVTFPEWSTAYLHITNNQHQPTSIKTPPINRNFSLMTPYLHCSLLLSHGVLPCDDGTVAVNCIVCHS